MRFAVIANPKARWFRKDPQAVESLYRVTSGKGLLLTPADDDELEAELVNLRDEGVEFLACAGGDGTVSHFTTALLRVWPHDALPPVALLHAGTMNTVSKSMGSRGDPTQQLDALVKSNVASLRRTRRWPMEIGERRWGYLFGIGMVPRFIQAYEDAGALGPAQAAVTLSRLIAAAAITGGSDLFSPVRADVLVDGQAWPMKSWLAVAAGAVDDMGLRFRPFAGVMQEPGAFGVFATASQPWRLALDLLPFRLGLPARHSLAFHHVGHALEIRAPEPLVHVIDGDLVQGGTTLSLRSGPPVTFLLPPDARPPKSRLDP